MANEFGRMIRRVRKARNLKQRQVGQAVGKSHAYISDLERGKRGSNISPIFAVRLAEFLGIDIGVMFKLTNLDTQDGSDGYKEYLSLTRNKERAGRIADSIGTLNETVKALRSAIPRNTPERELVETLDSSLQELYSSLRG